LQASTAYHHGMKAGMAIWFRDQSIRLASKVFGPSRRQPCAHSLGQMWGSHFSFSVPQDKDNSLLLIASFADGRWKLLWKCQDIIILHKRGKPQTNQPTQPKKALAAFCYRATRC